MQRIAVRLPTWVGDAVMATPALRALRAGFPSAHICVEGRPALRDLLDGLDSFDRFAVDPGRGARALRDRVRALRAGRFDLAVLLPDSPRAALGPFLARVPHRIGHVRDPLRGLLVTQRLAHARRGGRRVALPTIERYLEIARRLGCPDRGTHPELAVSTEASARLAGDLARHGIADDRRLLVVTPGASFGDSKLWPAEHFARACDRISAELGLLPVLAPGPGEGATAEGIAARLTAPALRRDCASLGELKALVARASLLLSNDTGPRHIAVALGRPCVTAMGPTNPLHTAVHLDRQRVLRTGVACSPCQLKRCPIDHRCMTQLHPERAVAAAKALLSSA